MSVWRGVARSNNVESTHVYTGILARRHVFFCREFRRISSAVIPPLFSQSLFYPRLFQRRTQQPDYRLIRGKYLECSVFSQIRFLSEEIRRRTIPRMVPVLCLFLGVWDCCNDRITNEDIKITLRFLRTLCSCPRIKMDREHSSATRSRVYCGLSFLNCAVIKSCEMFLRRSNKQTSDVIIIFNRLTSISRKGAIYTLIIVESRESINTNE